jgi:succinate dehydrogenase/fumarate reductase flavoprotein subunit
LTARRECNVLVIGGGLAGAQAAEGAAQFVSDVLLVDDRLAGLPPATLEDAAMLAAYLAQDAGGVSDWKSTRVSLSVQGIGGPAETADGAAIRRGFDAYVEDILAHGGRLGDPTIADFTAAGIYNRIGWLESYGLHVVRDASGAYRGFPSPAHGLNRVLLVEEPAAEVLERVRKSARVFGATFAEGLYVTRLFVEDGRVRGAYALDVRSGEPHVIETRAIVLASGGADRLYGATGTAGAGYLLALDAGASLANMEFVAFAPEPANERTLTPGLLMVLLGLGARLEPDGGASAARAPRQRAHLHVPGDLLATIADLPPFRPHRSLLERPVEVRTGCRGLLGGVVHRAFSAGVDGLFVAGAVATGCHGADLLPGVDTSFTLYSAENAATAAAAYWSRTRPLPLSEDLVRAEEKRLTGLQTRPRTADGDRLTRLADAVREVMWSDVGPARDARGLGEARRRLRALAAELETLGAAGVANLVTLSQAHALVTTAQLAAEAAAMREESRGQHVRTDFPALDEAGGQTWITATKRNGALTWSRMPVPVVSG